MPTKYEEWEASRTYTVLRSSRTTGKTIESVLATGLSLESANAMCDRLGKQYSAAHPEKTSWTRDLFFKQLENPWSPES